MRGRGGVEKKYKKKIKKSTLRTGFFFLVLLNVERKKKVGEGAWYLNGTRNKDNSVLLLHRKKSTRGSETPDGCC